MLYISRHAGNSLNFANGSYYVIDSADGIEKSMTQNEIEALVNKGVEVKGVTLVDRSGLFAGLSPRYSIQPYMGNITQKVAKFSSLLGIDFQTLKNGKLTYLNCHGNTQNKPLRLSDICKIVGNYSIYLEQGTYTCLIFDDKCCRMEKDALGETSLSNGKIYISVQEVSDLKAAYKLYEVFNRNYSFDCIKDIPERHSAFDIDFRIYQKQYYGSYDLRPFRSAQEEQCFLTLHKQDIISALQMPIKPIRDRNDRQILANTNELDTQFLDMLYMRHDGMNSSQVFHREIIGCIGYINANGHDPDIFYAYRAFAHKVRTIHRQ